MAKTTTTTFRGFRSPNYTQVPDELFDELLPELSGAELKVLLYIIRRTFGFKKESDSISLNQITNGIETREGEVLDRGTGLSKASVATAVKNLEARGVVVRQRRRSSEKGDEPTTYSLNILPLSKNQTPPGSEIGHPPVQELDTQETVRQQTERSHSNIRMVSPAVDKSATPAEHTHAVTTPRQAGGVKQVGTIVRQRRQPRQTPQSDEAYQIIQAYIEDFRRELNDQATLKQSTMRAYHLYQRAGLDVDAFIGQLYAARAIVKERTGSIRTRGADTQAGLPTKQKAAYYFAVLADLLGLKEDPSQSLVRDEGER